MNSYSQHFDKLKKQKKSGRQRQTKMSLGYQSNRVKKDHPFLQILGLFSLIGFCLALYGVLYPENIEKMAQVKIQFFSQSLAESTAKTPPSNVGTEAKNSIQTLDPQAQKTESATKAVSENTSHIEQLLEKEKHLVEREKRIAEMEAKLQIAQSEMDKKIEQLDQMRREIASKLESRVKTDDESIEKLVGVYSNMKPQSAAQVIAKLDENLAISILKKMKKQDAGSILNFMDPQKAKVLSEKYSGY